MAPCARPRRTTPSAVGASSIHSVRSRPGLRVVQGEGRRTASEASSIGSGFSARTTLPDASARRLAHSCYACSESWLPGRITSERRVKAHLGERLAPDIGRGVSVSNVSPASRSSSRHAPARDRRASRSPNAAPRAAGWAGLPRDFKPFAEMQVAAVNESEHGFAAGFDRDPAPP